MHRFFCASVSFLAATLAPGLTGQSLGLTGPTQGVVFDSPSKSLRPVAGSFGSATLGPALLSGLDFASMSPTQTRGIGCQAELCFWIPVLGTLQRGATPLLNQTATPEGAAWSADGAVAAIYSRSGQWIRVLGAEDAPPQQSVSSLGGQLSAVAVSPDGRHVVLAVRGEHPGVYEFTASGNYVSLLAAADPIRLAYASNGTLYVLDGRQISEIGADGLLQSWPIETVADPVDLQPGRDASGRAVVYVAGSDDHALFVYDAAKHTLTSQIALTFAPSQVEPSGSGGYLLTERASADQLLWAYDVGRGVFFVPVTPVEIMDAERPTLGPLGKVRR